METSLQACIDSQHAPRTARPVAVVEINPLALQDEGADAVLREGLVSCGGQDGELARTGTYPGGGDGPDPSDRHCAEEREGERVASCFDSVLADLRKAKAGSGCGVLIGPQKMHYISAAWVERTC